MERGCGTTVHPSSMDELDHHGPPSNTILDIATGHGDSYISLVSFVRCPLDSSPEFPK